MPFTRLEDLPTHAMGTASVAGSALISKGSTVADQQLNSRWSNVSLAAVLRELQDDEANSNDWSHLRRAATSVERLQESPNCPRPSGVVIA